MMLMVIKKSARGRVNIVLIRTPGIVKGNKSFNLVWFK